MSKRQCNNAREKAIDILVILEQKKGYSNLVLQEQLQNCNLDSRDRALVTELVYGTIQRLNTIDYIVNFFLKKRSLETLDSWIRQLLRITVYQIRFLSKIPERAAVFEAVEIAKSWGHQGVASFINGVMRNILRSPDTPAISDKEKNIIDYTSLTYSLPNWLVNKWFDQFGEDTVERYLHNINEPPRFTVRHNRLRSNKQEFEQLLTNSNQVWENSSHIDCAYYLKEVGDISKSKLFNEGYYTIQDESSMFVAKVLDPFPKAAILDACAAPGGKTTHLAELQGDKGYIIANELYPHKLLLIQSLAEKLGINSINLQTGDFMNFNSDLLFDYVLLDAPCSGLGVIQRKPEIKWRMNEQSIKSLIQTQKKLIRHAAKFIKPGGSLVYSTCTINKEENEDLIEGFLAEYTEFHGNDIRKAIPELLHEYMENQYSIQILPNYMNSDGFYIAKLTRE